MKIEKAFRDVQHPVKMLNSVEANRSYSTIHGNNAIGTGHATSMINSALGWAAGANRAGEWMCINAEK